MAVMNKTRIKRSRGDLTFDIVNITISVLLLIIVAYPLYFVVIASISDPSAVSSGQVVLYPIDINLDGYKEVIGYEPIWSGYRNTIFYTIGYTFLSVMISLMSGFAFSRGNLPGKKIFLGIFIFTMFFNGGLIPTYLIVRNLGLYGNPIIIILLGAVNVNNIIISRTFIKSTIPEELFEAAALDGCSHAKTFFRVVLPVSQSLIAVLVLFAAVAQWNSWFNAMIYLNDENQMPLQMILRDLIVNQSAMAMASDAATSGGDAAAAVLLVESMRYAVIIVSSLPLLCVYPFVQKYFVKGIMIGSVKG